MEKNGGWIVVFLWGWHQLGHIQTFVSSKPKERDYSDLHLALPASTPVAPVKRLSK